MIEVTSEDAKAGGIAHLGSQPIALAAGALIVIVLGIGSIALWRAYTGSVPEQDRVVAARQIQARTAQASEQLVEKTRGLEVSEQVSGLAEAIEGLRQSFASAQGPDPSGSASTRNKSIRTRSQATVHRKH